MSITGISAASVLSAQTAPDPVASDIKALQSALSQGNITVAQAAFATLQAALSSIPQTSSQAQQFTQNTQAGQAYDALRTALQKGNLSAAQSAYSAVQSSLKSGWMPPASIPAASSVESPEAIEDTPAGDTTTVGSAFSVLA
jgi:hypothetical protein